jgi:hypothetical protein
MRVGPRDDIAFAKLGVVLVALRSLCSVAIGSKDAGVAPAINGFKRAREFWASSSSLLDFNIRVEKLFGGGSCRMSRSRPPSGTASGPSTKAHAPAPWARLATRMPWSTRVCGVKGLRVVGATTFLFLPSGHTPNRLYVSCNPVI